MPMAKYIKVGYKTPARLAAFREMIKKSAAAKLRRFPERFWARVNKNTESGCWEWIGKSISTNGYANIKRGGKRGGVHRFSFEMHVGPIPIGMMVCHKCDNKRCVNPSHLFLGSNRDNQVDSYQKGRLPTRGEQHGLAKFTEADIKEIRNTYSAGLASQKDLSIRFVVVKSHISRIINRRRWRHVA